MTSRRHAASICVACSLCLCSMQPISWERSSRFWWLVGQSGVRNSVTPSYRMSKAVRSEIDITLLDMRQASVRDGTGEEGLIKP
ncbi:hypothetical protein BDZ45DRAFT_500027 [Acephala macrosclerotiorum]|nr:hypothetical protein BDZ45DRAFT_500027 [Acephala macrosclerotiorum]